MADGNISQIQLPNGKKYAIKDATVNIDSEYNSANQEVVLILGSIDDNES